jgi:hypothetical protein
MTSVGLELTIPLSEQQKTVHALDSSATVTGHDFFSKQSSIVVPIYA